MTPGTTVVEEPQTLRPTVLPRTEPAVAADLAWWLWPHLLSLDAPLVAVVWQGWWAREIGLRLPWRDELLLGFGVWLIYIADRVADTAPTVRRRHKTARHAFHRRARFWMQCLALTIFLGLSSVAPWVLSMRQLAGGLGLLGFAGAYFWLVHYRRTSRWTSVLPKEAVVAGMFVAGTTFFVGGKTGVSHPGFLVAAAIFGGLCFLNCALITKWERDPADVDDAASLLNAFPWLVEHLRAGCLLLALLAIAASLGPWPGGVFVPVVGSSALLFALDLWRDRISADALRVLADAALLTPALLTPALCWSATFS